MGARIERISMAAVSSVSGHLLGRDAAFEQHVPLMVQIISHLIDHGAVISDHIEQRTSTADRTIRAPKFRNWPGTAEDWIDRFRTELEALGRLPDLYEIGWIRIPPHVDQPGDPQ